MAADAINDRHIRPLRYHLHAKTIADPVTRAMFILLAEQAKEPTVDKTPSAKVNA
jgi:hypothetical protein